MEMLIRKIVTRALKEDQSHKDITTNILVPAHQFSEAYIVAKEKGVVCGLEVTRAVFRRLDPKIEIHFLAKDGDRVRKNQRVVEIKGKTRAILSGERVALNFLSYLSGVATVTHRFVKRIHPYRVQVLDTRKTIPGLRVLVKMAVRVGGGVNHRLDLKEMVLIKDNHLIAYKTERTIPQAIRLMRKRTKKMIVVEVDTLAQLKDALEAQPDIILLDNMTPAQIRKAVAMNRKSVKPCLLEASGGITLGTIRSVARTGVDRISIGALTHSPKAIDFSMEFIS